MNVRGRRRRFAITYSPALLLAAIAALAVGEAAVAAWFSSLGWSAWVTTAVNATLAIVVGTSLRRWRLRRDY